MPCLGATLDLEGVVDLVQAAAVALDDGCRAMFRLKRIENLGLGVGLGTAGGDAGVGEPLCKVGDRSSFPPIYTYRVGWQRLKKIDSSVVELNKLLALLIAGVTVRLECADACAVSLPLVLPQLFISVALVLPVLVHVVEKIVGAELLENAFGIVAAGVAVLLE